MRDNSIMIKKILPPVQRRAKLAATMFNLSPGKEKEIGISLSDKRPAVPGVAWSPRYRKYRAYLHQGRKQVFHKLCDTFVEACQARADAETRFGSALPSLAPFSRELHAPAWFRLERALQKVRDCSTALSYDAKWAAVRGLNHRGNEERSNRTKLPYRKKLGYSIGGLITVVSQLVMAGELKMADIEDGMTTMAHALVNPEEAK